MVQIVLIRPGSTDYDRQGRIQGTLDIPLCEQGGAEVQRLIDEVRPLGITAVYGSPCRAAWQTASALSEALGVKAKKLEKMQNLDQGLWQGMLVDEVKRKQPTVYRQWQEQPEIICPPEGEMVTHAQERVHSALSKLLRKHKSGAIALVVPEPLASMVRSHLVHSELADLWKSHPVCGSWEVIPTEPQQLVHPGVEIADDNAAGGRGALPIGLG